MADTKNPPGAEDIIQARTRIGNLVKHTPVVNSERLDRLLGCRVFSKAECLQETGSFKARGATNAVFSLAAEKACQGVATHSSGNHAAALARAAALRGVPAYIVMPANAPRIKVQAVEYYGAKITFCEPTLSARQKTLQKVITDTGACFIHPYDEPLVIAGQATAALELFEQVPKLDLLLAPIGGGGLMSGCALATALARPSVRLVGTEPRGADDAFRSLQEGRLLPQENPQTIADGLRTQLSELTFSILSRHLERIVTVSEEAMVKALRLAAEHLKLVIEPSAAVPLAALLECDFGQRGKNVGVILSGGNVEPDALAGYLKD